jgi:hypothetical protein
MRMRHCSRCCALVRQACPVPREESLLRAQRQAEQPFAEVLSSGLIRAGVLESELNNEIDALAHGSFHVRGHCHRASYGAARMNSSPTTRARPIGAWRRTRSYIWIAVPFSMPGRPILAAAMCSDRIRASTIRSSTSGAGRR